MKIFEATISGKAVDFLESIFKGISQFETANVKIVEAFRVNNFFESQDEYEVFKRAIVISSDLVGESDRAEYGDFQTNLNLAKRVAGYINDKDVKPNVVIEPTCGKGHFIIAALGTFKGLNRIVGVEIYKPYTWQSKFNIIDYYVSNPTEYKPFIDIHHCNVFDFDFRALLQEGDHVLVLGNPPWVTNAKLSTLDSDNLPVKSNFKKYNGFDAITGKGNFDIGEYITLMMLDAFHKIEGDLAFLVKNSVVKNIVFGQHDRTYNISDIQKLTIDSKKEFDVAVEASLLYCKLNSTPEYKCKEFNFYNPRELVSEFGWVDDKFVSNVQLYSDNGDIDGMCPFEWRQGVKHDLASIMELEKVNGHFVNGNNQEIVLENDLVFGILKSSDLKNSVISKSRKFTIITQKKVGGDTSFISKEFPHTFSYLQAHRQLFDQRKSSIYNNKPAFSIFGIGDYSFAPYKVAISGLYKTFSFSLVLPSNGKPIMMDDTCYLLGFKDLLFAAYTYILLNSKRTTEFLRSITFSDAKRTFTKDVLMRIDLHSLALQFSEKDLCREIAVLNEMYGLDLSIDKWGEYLQVLKPNVAPEQMSIF